MLQTALHKKGPYHPTSKTMTSLPSVLMVSLAVVLTVVTAGESVRITETMTGVEMDVDAQSGANTIVLVMPRRYDVGIFF